jgi:hypothetical protein
MIATLAGLAALFALGVLIGMISAAGYCRHLEGRLHAALDALTAIAAGDYLEADGDAAAALSHDEAVRRGGIPRALD